MRRPLDPAFTSTPSRAHSKKGKAKSAAIIGVLLAGLAGTGTVFAANVGINDGSSISYSQGTQVIAACDPDGIGVQLEFGFNTTNNIWLINHNRQGLTGVHSDCFSVYAGVKRTLKVSFYEGTTLQATITGSMPLRSYSGFSVDTATNNNTLYFAGTGQTLNETNGMGLSAPKACSGGQPSSTSWLCGTSFNTSSPTISTSAYTQPTVSWSSGCAAIANQPTVSPSDLCRPWHLAANSDPMVIEIE